MWGCHVLFTQLKEQFCPKIGIIFSVQWIFTHKICEKYESKMGVTGRSSWKEI